MSCVQLEGILFPIMQRMITQDGQDVFEEVHSDNPLFQVLFAAIRAAFVMRVLEYVLCLLIPPATRLGLMPISEGLQRLAREQS